MKYELLPETIGIKEYSEWRNCGRNSALKRFHSKGFPLIDGLSLKADKRAVLLFELGLNSEDRKVLLKEIAKEII